MIVIEAFESTEHHRVAEVRWPLKNCDSTRQCLPHTEMTGFPGDLIVEFKQPAPPAGFREWILCSSLGCRKPGLDFLVHAGSGLVCLRGQADDFLEFQPRIVRRDKPGCFQDLFQGTQQSAE